jgi:uncharacterized protein
MFQQPEMNPFITKVASRCNLNCSYCYVYNKADTQWKARPALMSAKIFDAMLDRVRRHCLQSGQASAQILFHGGEPMLVGPARFDAMCERAKQVLGDVTQVILGIQTNGTRLDQTWIDIFRRHQVQVGISMDGPKEVHDAVRVDHKGRGSHDIIARNMGRLREGGIPFTILSVIPLGADPVRVHRHFLDLGCDSVSYLLPSYTHDTIEPIRAEHGPTPCADFLIPIFDDWWFNGTIDFRIREFWSIGRVIMGGETDFDNIGNPPLRYVGIETDGSIEGAEKLRTCEDGMSSTGLNVLDADFSDIGRVSDFHAAVISGMELPSGCRGCPEQETCAGGYVAHRYSRDRQFDNPSIWCADLLKIFGHIRSRLGVSHERTVELRRERERAALAEMS